MCDKCAKLLVEYRKISSDFLTAFGGKGRRGFVQWLKMGKFLQVIEDEAEVNWYNDRVAVIHAMIGQEKLDRLLDNFAMTVLMIAKEGIKANE